MVAARGHLRDPEPAHRRSMGWAESGGGPLKHGGLVGRRGAGSWASALREQPGLGRAGGNGPEREEGAGPQGKG